MFTHEGAAAEVLSNEDQLRRSVLSCLLWDNTFYENGQSINQRIQTLASQCDPEVVACLAIEARGKYKLRSVPLVLANELVKKGGSIVSKTIEKIIQRPDEITKLLSLYWDGAKKPIAKQMKKGLAKSFQKFNEYQLAKWNRDGNIRLRDAMFLVHPKPLNEQQAELWKKLAEDKLETPDTWEVGLSSAKTLEEKKQVWVRLLTDKKLGGLALLKNLRNMSNVGVDRALIIEAIQNIKTERILPYRFVTAAKFAPEYRDYLEGAMYRCLAGREKVGGKTVLLVDVSGSMDDVLGKKDHMYNGSTWSNTPNTSMSTTRLDAAIGLAILLRFLCVNVEIYTFSDKTVKIDEEPYGFRLGEKINKSQEHNGTQMGKAVKYVTESTDFDRMIVITDEQSRDNITNSIAKKGAVGYIMNVAPYEHGIDHGNEWTRITGFSEAVIDWMLEHEKPSYMFSKYDFDKLFTFTWEESK